MLSLEQEIAFQKFSRGENLLISGPGGTGKSFLIKTLVEHMCSRDEFNFQVTSTTGCSSVLLSNSIDIDGKNLSVKTINTWSGIKLCKGDNETIIKNVLKNPKMLKTWRKIKTLIIDEVSMISCKMFDILMLLAKKTRNSGQPFGGIQLVLFGDYLQLPPISDLSDPETSKFAFESKEWYEVIPPKNHIELKTIFRQKDEIFKKILNEVRIGELSLEGKEILKSYVGRKYVPEEHNGIIPIQILPTRKQVLEVNSSEYEKVIGKEFKFISKVDVNHTVLENGQEISEKDKRIFKNLTEQEKNYEVNSLRSSIPVDDEISLKVGVPVMILVNLDLENGISNGTQGIVTSMRNNNPVVRLMNGSERVILPYMWRSPDYPSIVISQLPLTLSYASSIHKQQGSTIDIARMTLGFSIFEDSQIYVALSRLTSLDGLYLTSFHPQKISVNKKAKAFYDSFNTPLVK
jgi:ATP-dependent DNA helicase PIF1